MFRRKRKNISGEKDNSGHEIEEVRITGTKWYAMWSTEARWPDFTENYVSMVLLQQQLAVAGSSIRDLFVRKKCLNLCVPHTNIHYIK